MPLLTAARPGRWSLVLACLAQALGLTPTLPTPPALAAPTGQPVCYAEYTGDNTPDFSSVDAGAVQAAVSAAPSDSTIKVAGYCAGVVAQGGTTQTLLITQPLTISGGYTVTDWLTYDPVANPTTLDAQGGGRVISTTAAAISVTLQGFTVTNGYISATLSEKGGGIFAAGALTLNDMAIDNNHLTSPLTEEVVLYGGGVYVAGVASLTHSRITHNSVISQPQNGFGAGGGAFFASTPTMSDSLFAYNIGGYGGGAAFMPQPYEGAPSIINTIFDNNIAAYSGGGGNFWLGAGVGSLTVISSTFTNNTALMGNGGGADFIMGDVALNLSHTTFAANTTGQWGMGGGANISGRLITVTNSSFSHNTSASGGGAMFWAGSANRDLCILSLRNVVFSDNQASNMAGGLSLYNDTACTSQVVDTTLSNNTATYGGGGNFYNFPEGTLSVVDTTFLNNMATSTGGGAHFYGATNMTGTTFLSNSATQNGGGANFVGATSLTGTTFVSNTTKTSVGGGAFFNNQASVVGATFLSNTAPADYGGGAYFAGPASVVDTTFTHNTAHQGAGGAYFGDTTNVTGTTFASNIANNSAGGGAYFNGPTRLSGTTFTDNTATNGAAGGAYFNDPTYLSGTTFTHNTAFSGGGAYFFGAASLLETTFADNTADQGVGGGAVFLNTTNVTGATFLRNTAANGGGAYFGAALPKQLVNDLFASNRATTNGAAIFVAQAAPLQLLHTTIVSPTAPTGAPEAIYVSDGTVYLTNTLIASHTVGIVQVTSVVQDWHTLFSGVATPYLGSITSVGGLTGTAAFVAPAQDDYHLLETSAARDAGIVPPLAVLSDFEGDPRPQGPGYDIGYDEYNQYRFILYLPGVSK